MSQFAPGLRVNQSLGLVSIVVRDYDDAIRFYVETLGFRLGDLRGGDNQLIKR
jgi:catechol 2,3-dioxygenase-like lactoylglutathione lyase family enzyme